METEHTKTKLPIPILLFVFPLLVTFCKVQSSPILWYEGTNNIHEGAQFQKNLNSAMSILNNFSSTAYFYNATVGSAPYKTYATFMCRYDFPLPVCHDCITNFTLLLLARCPGYWEAASFNWMCGVHYANRSIFSQVDLIHSYTLCDFPALNDTALNRTVERTISELIDNVTSITAGRQTGYYFAVGKQTYMVDQTLHGLVQCAPNTNPSDCRKCLTAAMYQALSSCQVSVGATCIYGSCTVAYSLYDFYDNASSSRHATNNSSLVHEPLPSSQIPLIGDSPSSSLKFGPDIILTNSVIWIGLLVMMMAKRLKNQE